MKRIKRMKWSGTFLLVFLALALNAHAQTPVGLGTAGNFGVLAGTGVTGGGFSNVIAGDVGSYPTPAITGFAATTVSGTLYTTASAVVSTAKDDLVLAYNDAAGRACTVTIASGQIGSGATPAIPSLGPGVYCSASGALLLIGNLNLAGTGSGDVWIFKMASTLTTATGASVTFSGGASPCNVFWQVGSSATIQSGNSFAGTIMALTNITLNGGTLAGRALARNAAVTITGQETIVNGCSATSPTASVVLSPVNSSIVCATPGSTITKTAVVLSNGVPLAGAVVTFTVTAGPDTGMTGTATTNASGVATFTFSGTFLLTSLAGDTIVATTPINNATVTSNQTFATCSGSNSGDVCRTTPYPTVTIGVTTTGPPKQVGFSVRALGGLFTLVANIANNATVAIQPFDIGTTTAVGVTATKINQSASAVIALTATDLCGHTTVFDPVFATITISASKSKARDFDFDHREVTRFNGIGHTEGIVTLHNGTPGVESLVIGVNGSQFKTRLSDGQTKKIDISSALHHGNNTVRVAAFGDSGSSVDLTISDGE